MSICSDSIQAVKLLCVDENKVTTIENLTTFHDYKGSELVIYLGGFSNHSKVELRKKFYHDIPALTFRHFGDIDFGGFSILSHIRRETGIVIEALHMDTETLLKRKDLAKRPGANYIKKLGTLLHDNYLQDCKEIINYMITHGVILEQETF